MSQHRAQRGNSGLSRRLNAWRWRFADRRQTTRDNWDSAAGRLRDTLPERPSWIDERLVDFRWKLEEWRCRLGLWWVRRYEPVAAAIARCTSRVAERLDEIRLWAVDRLNPVLWRISELCRARAEAAAVRRMALASRIAELRERHLEPAVRKVEHRIADTQAGAAVSEAVQRSGLSWLHLVGGAAAAVLVGWAVWRLAPPPAPTLSAEELAMLANFQRPAANDDPTAWLREAAAPPPPPPGARPPAR